MKRPNRNTGEKRNKNCSPNAEFKVPVKLQPADRVQSKVMPFMVIEHSRRNEQKQSTEKVINEEAQNNRLAADFSEHAD